MQKTKLNLHICGIHLLNPCKTVVSHLKMLKAVIMRLGLLCLLIGLKNLWPILQPMRNKTKTNCTLYTLFFPAPWVRSQVTACLEFWWVHCAVCSHCDCMVGKINLVLVSGQSFQNLNSQLNCCRDIREIMSVT
mgnify:CR=1 FL=1